MRTLRQKRVKDFKERIMKNNVMKRFLLDIAREDALDETTQQMMLAYQPVRVRR